MEVKEVKDCIDFLNSVWSVPIIGKDKLNKEWLYKIISLLQQGKALKAENVELRAYKEIVEKLKLSERDIDIWWGRMSFRQKSTIIKGGEHLCMPLRNQHYEEFWDDLTNDEKTKIYIEYKNT